MGIKQNEQNEILHEYDNDDVEYEDDYGYPDYVGFDEWKDRYIQTGKKKYGTGYCWDFLEFGECGDPHCRFKHSLPSTRNKSAGNNKKSTLRMHFGKHRGKLLHEIPRSYVVWMEKNDVLSN